MKRIKTTLLMVAMLMLMAANTQAAWYACKVTNITPKVNGVVAVKFVPGATETKFTALSRAEINPNDPGAKNMLATLLTAVSLNKEVSIDLSLAPSTTYQDIMGLSLKSE